MTNQDCVECRQLQRMGKHPARQKDQKARSRYEDDPGKHALDNHLRAQDTGAVTEVWDE